MTGPGTEKAGQAYPRTDRSPLIGDVPQGVAVKRRRVTVTFHEPGTPPLRGTAQPAALPSRPMGGGMQTWQVIVILLALTAGAAAIVFAAARAVAGTGAVGGLVLGLAGTMIRKRRGATRSP